MNLFSSVNRAVASTFNVVTTSAGVVEASVNAIGKTVDAISVKADDLHANWTDNADIKRKRMLQHSLAAHTEMHATRMLEIEERIQANPKLADMVRRIKEAEAAQPST